MQTLIMKDGSGGIEFQFIVNDDNEVMQCNIIYEKPKPMVELINLHALSVPNKINYGNVPPAMPTLRS